MSKNLGDNQKNISFEVRTAFSFSPKNRKRTLISEERPFRSLDKKSSDAHSVKAFVHWHCVPSKGSLLETHLSKTTAVSYPSSGASLLGT